MEDSEENVDDQEVEIRFADIVNEEQQQEEIEEWIKTHGLFSLADVSVGAASLEIVTERMQMCLSHIYRAIGNGVELGGPVGDDGIAIFKYPDEETKRIFEG